VPTSLRKGEGQYSCNLASEGAEVVSREATSLNRREGLAGGCLSVVASDCGRESEGGGERIREEWAKVNCDGVDGRFKLCLPSQIMFDMSVCEPNNRIRICITLYISQRCEIYNFRSKYIEISILFEKYAKIVVSTIAFIDSLLYLVYFIEMVL
jgi:hypothetical protein